jgi:hypothetical protein
MEYRSCEAHSRPFDLEIPRLLWNPKVQQKSTKKYANDILNQLPERKLKRKLAYKTKRNKKKQRPTET